MDPWRFGVKSLRFCGAALAKSKCFLPELADKRSLHSPCIPAPLFESPCILQNKSRRMLTHPTPLFCGDCTAKFGPISNRTRSDARAACAVSHSNKVRAERVPTLGTARRREGAATPKETAPCISDSAGVNSCIQKKERAVSFGVLPFGQGRRKCERLRYRVCEPFNANTSGISPFKSL